ncbi:MAG TPA: transcription-repair coupling factor, partial [Brevibacterium sp.]|nr:transcription-repair coupling factor [Brevibacterium sp.]
MLTGLSNALTLPAFDDVRRAVADPSSPGGSVSLVRGLLPALISRTAKTGTALVVTATTREAEDLARALADHLPPESVAVFPSWETLPHERLSPRSDTVGERLTVLRRLSHPDDGTPLRVVIAPVRAALQPLVKGLGQLEPVELGVGDRMDLTDLSESLAGLAYSRVDMVSRRGEFAVRGGIIDVFPPTAES